MSKFRMALLACTVGALISGCSNTKSPPVKHKPITHNNGTIASMKLVHVNGQNPNIKIYKMFYWSEGKQVEALLTEPKDAGANDYPLYVMCHGGYAVPMSRSHAASPVGIKDLMQNGPNVVEIAPQYRGYADSEGTVQGLYGDSVDTENAIIAADSLSAVNNTEIRLVGVSLGGGVVLQIASDPQYANNVLAVVAVSPFTGWDNVISWALQHDQTSQIANGLIQQGLNAYGKFTPNNKAYLQNSVEVSKIDVPVLLEQGTGDTNVPWQTVQKLYYEMKKDNETVKLDLYPGGTHGLQGRYAKQSFEDQVAWFNEF